MRKGGGKQKGNSFERDCCKKLSRWITNGKRDDCFWRSSLSGGRATVAKKAGKEVRQSGDITAVSPEGHSLTDRFFIECKFYSDLQIDSFLLQYKGNLARFWTHCVKQAKQHERSPMLIARQNHKPALVIVNWLIQVCDLKPLIVTSAGIEIYMLEDVLKSTYVKGQRYEPFISVSENRQGARRRLRRGSLVP